MSTVQVPAGVAVAQRVGRRRRIRVPPPAAWNRWLVALPSAAILVLGYQRRWLSDDALIVTRTVRQILAGNGPVFSPGERAETSTSTAWQWLLALAAWVTQSDPARLAVYTGLLLTGAGFALALDGTRRLHGASGQRLLPLGIVVLLAVPPVWDYATSGLETGLVTVWLGACWRVLVATRADQSFRRTSATAVLVGLGPLVRPELGIVSIALLLALWLLLRPPWRRTLLVIGIAGLLPGAYQVFRMGYYGLLVPMPALTKEAGTSYWGRGMRYLTNFLDSHWLYVVLAVAAVLVARLLRDAQAVRERVLLATPVVCGVLYALYVVWVGGDWMRARMLLPSLFLLMLPVLLVPVTRWHAAAVAGIAAWVIIVATPLRWPLTADFVTPMDVRVHTIEVTGRSHPITAADRTRAFPDVSAAVARDAAGTRRVVLVFDKFGRTLVPVPLSPDEPTSAVVGSYLGMTGAVVPLDHRVVDRLSLAYPLGAHLHLARDWLPGHEKEVDNVWILADYGAVADLPPELTDELTNPESIRAARAALACGDLLELQESARAPLTWGRFWKNVTGSYHRTQLRVPRSPFEAVEAFCPR